MPYTVYITETSYTSASFATKEEAEAFMEEPDYDLCRSWEMSESNIELVEDVTVWQLAQGGLRSPSKPDILHSYLRHQMSKPFIISTFSKDVSGEYFNYFADTYEEAVKLAEDFYLQTGRVVAVERVAQHP